MEKIAIIGTGIAGMGCGHLLHSGYDLTFYEKNDYIGGHTNSITLDMPGEQVTLDTGFMVYNEVTYPNLTSLFKRLGVQTMPTSMSFSVQYLPEELEFCGSGLDGLFAQRRNFFRPSYYKFLRDLNRFNKESPEVLNDPAFTNHTVADYIFEKGFDPRILEHYLLPMSSAVWSAPPDTMMAFPIQTLVRFFYNHGFLGLNTQHPWRTVVGGSRAYRDRLIAPFRQRIHTGRGAISVFREGLQAVVAATDGSYEKYDHVLLACHADEALSLLAEPTPLERELLSPFRYQKNIATVHTDETVMPKTRRAWSSWNYRTAKTDNDTLSSSTVYWMNNLQRVSEKQNYFVSIDGVEAINPAAVLRSIEYHHPVFTLDAIEKQERLAELNCIGPLMFCGSYFGYGFHEDALTSAIDLCRHLTRKEILV